MRALHLALALMLLAPAAHATEELASPESVLTYVRQYMPATDWERAEPAPNLPGYFRLHAKGSVSESAPIYFDQDKRYLLIGLPINLDARSPDMYRQQIGGARNF